MVGCGVGCIVCVGFLVGFTVFQTVGLGVFHAVGFSVFFQAVGLSVFQAEGFWVLYAFVGFGVTHLVGFGVLSCFTVGHCVSIGFSDGQ